MTRAASSRSRAQQAARWLRLGLLLALGLYFVGRALVELGTVDPAQPQTYRQDWGGPSYVGVLLVHIGPAVVVVLATALWVRRRRHGALSGTPRRLPGEDAARSG